MKKLLSAMVDQNFEKLNAAEKGVARAEAACFRDDGEARQAASFDNRPWDGGEHFATEPEGVCNQPATDGGRHIATGQHHATDEIRNLRIGGDTGELVGDEVAANAGTLHTGGGHDHRAALSKRRRDPLARRCHFAGSEGPVEARQLNPGGAVAEGSFDLALADGMTAASHDQHR